VLTAPARLGEWTDARVVSVEPPGRARPGQRIHMRAPALGLEFGVRIDVGEMDTQHRWIDLLVHLPLGIQNHEHVTLTPTQEGGTLVRFN
jgi:hypothetical protein